MSVSTNEGYDGDSMRVMEIDRSNSLPTPSAPWNTVVDRFDSTMYMANTMLERLIGTNMFGGYLGILNELIDETAPVVDIEVDDINTGVAISAVKSPPSFNSNDLGTFPIFSAPDPDLEIIPLVDVSTLEPPKEPDDINPSINWSELPLSQDIYPKLLARILTDITYGATGLTDEVQEALFLSGTNRQQSENDAAYQKVQNDMASRGATLPTGALLGAITEINAEILRQNSEINRTVITTTADLAQKNSQFIIEQARALEAMLRDTRDKDSNRSMDYEKSLASMVIQIYSEKIRMYIAIAEANKIYVEAQVANLQAVASYNMSLLSEYRAMVQVFTSRVDAIASENSSIVEIYKAEVSGYDSETQAISRVDSIKLDKVKVDIEEANLQLRAAIANADALLGGFTAESSLKEKVSNDMANIANQALVGALSSVNASASLGYSGSESKSEQWSHSDSLGESHSYSHDPEA